jgi:hypothetical protein
MADILFDHLPPWRTSCFNLPLQGVSALLPISAPRGVALGLN